MTTTNAQITNEELKAMHELYRKLRGSENLTIYAFGGMEGDRITYVAKLRFSDLVRYFSLVPSDIELPKNLMLQRELVKSRATNIKNYILKNKDFIFPEVISVCESLQIEEVNDIPNLYRITLPAQSFRYLVDGQGRLMGISDSLKNDASLKDQTIDIKLVQSEGIQKDTQLFSDINMTPVAPNKSQCAAMDSRKVVNRFAKEVVEQVSQLTPLVDYTKASVTNSSKTNKLWTLNQIVAFVLMVTGTTAKSCETELACNEKQRYLTGFIAKYLAVLQQNKDFGDAISGKKTASEVRESTIVGTSVFLKSIALMGKVLMMNFISRGDAQADWSIIDGWKDIDLSKSNKEWLGRCMNYRGGYEDKSFNHKAMASYFLTEMGLDMPEELEEIEEEVLVSRAAMLRAKREAEKEAKAANSVIEVEAA